MNTLNNLTPLAQQTLFLARKEAERLNSVSVGTEHLLLGLIRLGQGVATTVLERVGVDLNSTRAELERLAGTRANAKREKGQPDYTTSAEKVLAWARKEAKELNHAFLGTEHILLGPSVRQSP